MEAYERPGTGRPTFYFGRALGQESSASDIFVTIRERLPGRNGRQDSRSRRRRSTRSSGTAAPSMQAAVGDRSTATRHGSA
jgi:hypothetical protein